MGGKLVNRNWVKLLVLCIVIIFIVIFLVNTDIDSTKQALRSVGFKFIYLLIITYVAYFFGTWSWHACLGKERKKISLFQLFSIRQIGETVGQFNPTSVVGGDILKANLLQPYQIDKAKALSSVAASRITAVLSQILLFLIACLFLVFNNKHLAWISSWGFGFAALIFLLLLIQVLFIIWISKTHDLERLQSSADASFIRKLKNRIQNLIIDIRIFYKNDRKMFWYSYFLAAIHWIIGSLEFYLILILLGFDISFLDGLLLDMSVIVFKSFGAFIPGQLGIEELGNKLMLTLVGISSATVWITVSILRRARQIVWIGIGFMLYFFIKKDVQRAAKSTSDIKMLDSQ